MNAVFIDRLFFILLAIFLLLYGIQAVTNVRIDLMPTLIGLCALGAGVIGLIKAFR